MSADPQLRERLERAARHVRVDAERRLDLIHDAAGRRGRGRRTRALAVAAAGGVLAVILVWQLRLVDEGPRSPAGAVPSGRIAFLGAQGSHRALFGLDVDTGEVSAISPETDSVLWAAWSPDGARLASIVEEPDSRYAIVVSEADGSDAVKILEEEATGAAGPDLIDVSWSPDGSRIAFSGRTVEGGVTRRTILIVAADGSGEPVTLEGLWTSVSWSPDGERLLVLGFPQAATRDGRFDLYTIRPDGSDLVQLTDDDAGEHEPAWSPDGTQILFASGEADYPQDVYIMDADGSDVRRLTDWEGLDVLPVWSPDGRWIAFASDRDATQEQQDANRSGAAIFSGLSLYAMRADGSDVTRLLESDAALPVSWTP